MEVLGKLESHVASWNENQLKWGVAFQDPDVSLEEYAQVSQETLQLQAAVATAIRVAVDEFPDPEVGEAFKPVVDHYQSRFDALSPLISASLSGTEGEFDAALTDYLELVDPERVAELLRSVFEDPVVAQLILDDAEARGVEGDPQEILEAFLATFSGGK